MAKYKIAWLPGDGIGKIVLPEARRVLDAVGFDADYVHADVGWDFWINEGNALPERTVEQRVGRHQRGDHLGRAARHGRGRGWLAVTSCLKPFCKPAPGFPALGSTCRSA